jgi:outer membrane protein insertion porin family
VVVVDESSVDWFRTVDVQSKVPDINPASLHAQLRALPDGVSTAQAIDKTVETITSALRKHGQTFVQVHPRIDPDLATDTVDVVSILEEGPHVHVERITIRGNSQTREYVIRREFDVAYNKVLIDRAERRLKNLEFFKAVKVTIEPGSPDLIVINVNLEEKSSADFSIHGGYNRYGQVAARANERIVD